MEKDPEMEMVATTPAPVGHNNPPACKCCPGCGTEFEAGGRGLGKTFCTDDCRRKFHAACKSEGGPLAPLVKAWHKTRHAAPGTVEAEVCRYARGQITKIAATFLEADEDMGRDAVAYVQAMMESGFQYADRTRR